MLDYERLDEVVKSITHKLSDPSLGLRTINNRAIQAKIWLSDPKVSSYMTFLRQEEEKIRQLIFEKMNDLIQCLTSFCIDTTLARSSITKDERIHPGSFIGTSLSDCFSDGSSDGIGTGTGTGTDNDERNGLDFDLFCLDAKERLYLILSEYTWIKDFFRLYPNHFFENSISFIQTIIPNNKKLNIKVKVIGLGVGGSLTVSGLKKRGIEHVIGYEKRSRHGQRSVTSRYQNASWRAYDIAKGLLDEKAYEHLVSFQQNIHVKCDDGSSKVLKSDRVQIILGSAIDSALASAERYGAELKFDCDMDSYYTKELCDDSNDNNDNDPVDIVALFTGAHTSNIFPGIDKQMKILSWPELSSNCKMWLQIKPRSDKRHAFTTRDIEVGAEHWHFAIESARKTVEDVKRIRDSLTTQYNYKKNKLGKDKNNHDDTHDDDQMKKDLNILEEEYQKQLTKITNSIQTIEDAQKEDDESRFDYIFANAPDNEYNQAKIDAAKDNGNVVIDGNYQVDIKIASKSAIYIDDNDDSSNCNGSSDTCADRSDGSDSSDSSDWNDDAKEAKKLCNQFSTNVIVMGGDACVPPNPMAAYGATLACEFAEMVVELAVSHGHCNSILSELENVKISAVDTDTDDRQNVCKEWKVKVKELKILFTQYYDARGRSENYFQWMQTLICNLYSLPPQGE